MVLDMEGEFFKLAKKILSKPKNLYKVFAISPHTGRVTVMGADNFMVVGSSVLRQFSRGKEDRAYRTGYRCGREMFGSLVKEFDEEVKTQGPKKLMELGLPLVTNTGWGDLELVSINVPRGEVNVKGERTIELGYSRAAHHMLTCGLLSGIVSRAFEREARGEVVKAGKDSVLFRITAA